MSPFSCVHIIPKLNSHDDPHVRRVVTTIADVAKRCGLDIVDEDNLREGSLIIAVGGDGTMLEAMRRSLVCKGTALGVNLGRVGFLSDISADVDQSMAFSNFLYILMQGMDGSLEKRIVLKNTISKHIACNEISFTSRSPDCMITYRLFVDDQCAGVHRANSLLISTPTGSTAYSLSAGGAIMTPSMQALQIVPVASTSLTSRPIIASHLSRIKVQMWSRVGVMMLCDGQVGYASSRTFTEDSPFEVECHTSSRKVTVLHPPAWNFFNVLSDKLGWIKE